jgi:hypothetical protein
MSGRWRRLRSIRDTFAAVAIALKDLPDHVVHEPVPPGIPLFRLSRSNLRIKTINEGGQLIFQIPNVMRHRIECVSDSLDLCEREARYLPTRREAQGSRWNPVRGGGRDDSAIQPEGQCQ